MGDIVGIVLGAGASTRLGRPKQTLPLGETTVLGCSVRNAERSSLDRIVVVVGGAEQETARSLQLERATTVSNDGYQSGCASSLLAGLDAAGTGTDAIVMLLGDMPGVDTRIIDHVIEAWSAAPAWAAITSYDDGLGHPFVFSSEAFAELRGLHGDKAVWKIIDREPEDRVRRIPVRRPTPRDVDTWDDYRIVCALFGHRPATDTVSSTA